MVEYTVCPPPLGFDAGVWLNCAGAGGVPHERRDGQAETERLAPRQAARLLLSPRHQFRLTALHVRSLGTSTDRVDMQGITQGERWSLPPGARDWKWSGQTRPAAKALTSSTSQTLMNCTSAATWRSMAGPQSTSQCTGGGHECRGLCSDRAGCCKSVAGSPVSMPYSCSF